MSTCDSVGVCPKCGYERAWYSFDCSSGGEYGACPRCGSGYDGFWDEDGQWIVEEYTGLGVIGYRVKDCLGLAWGTYQDSKELDEFRIKLVERKGDFKTAFYTYQEGDLWCVHDLLGDQRMLATEESVEGICRPIIHDDEDQEVPQPITEMERSYDGADAEFQARLEAL